MKIKDETCSVLIKRFVELKPILYTYITEEDHESKKAKDINKNYVDDELKYEAYKNVLFNRTYKRHETNRIQSKVHNIGTYRTNKISLSYYSDKEYIIADG